MRLLYSLGVHLIALASLFRRKSRPLFLKRLGVGIPRLEGVIWVHAVSLGETKAVAPLIRRLKGSSKVFLTTVTATGHEEGKRSLPEADAHFFLPFDFPYLMKRLMRRLKPRAIILSETDFWRHFQYFAKENGAKIILVNGKMSERSFKRLSRLPKLASELLGTLNLACVQSSAYAERFKKLGCRAVEVTGNLKFDGVAMGAPLDLGFAEGDFVITLGSTHAPEEKWLLKLLKPLLGEFPHLKLVIAPRHPERFDEVARLLQGEDFTRYSELRRGARIVLLDAMGLLCRAYGLSHLAFVGGSLTPRVGGHNILEPASDGVPVLHGPYMQAQSDLVALAREYGSALEVTLETFGATCRSLLNDPGRRERLGRSGIRLMKEASGSLEKTYAMINPLLEKRGVDKLIPSSRDGAVVSSLGS